MVVDRRESARLTEPANFLIRFFVFLVAILLVAALLNYLVNPYEIFPPSSLQFGLVKTEIGPKASIVKQVQVYRQQPNCVFVGSSRGQYLDPDHEAVSGYKCLNIAGGYIRSISRAHEAIALASRMSDLSLVILGLDLRMFRKGWFDVGVRQRERPEALSRLPQHLFSATTLVDSIVTLLRQLDANLMPLYLPNGQRNPQANHLKIKQHGGHVAAFRSAVSPVNTRVLDEVSLNEEIMADLSGFLELAHLENIDLRIYLSPSHAWWWNAILEKGLWDLFEEWKRKVVLTNETVARRMKKAPFAIYDFAGYYSYTTVPPTREAMKYHFEASHFTPELGGKVLDSVMNTSSAEPEFGVSLGSDNLEQSLVEMRERRDSWQAAGSLDDK